MTILVLFFWFLSEPTKAEACQLIGHLWYARLRDRNKWCFPSSTVPTLLRRGSAYSWKLVMGDMLSIDQNRKNSNMSVEISQLLLWSWNDERSLSWQLHLVRAYLADVSTRCSSPTYRASFGSHVYAIPFRRLVSPVVGEPVRLWLHHYDPQSCWNNRWETGYLWGQR